MDIAGHVSRQMLGRYSHIRIEAKRKALEAVGTTEVLAEAQPAQTQVVIDRGHKTGHNPPPSANPHCWRRANNCFGSAVRTRTYAP